MLKTYKSMGVTLFEIIIILAIIIILTVASVPSIISVIKRHRLTGTAESLFNALQLARSEAVKRNTNVYVSFATGDSWCYGINPGTACDCNTAGSCTLGATTAGQSQQISLSLNGFGTSMYFEGSHGAANMTGSITFTLYNDSPLITLNVGRLGNVQMCSTGVSGYTAC